MLGAARRSGVHDVNAQPPRTYFLGREADDQLEGRNFHFWRSLLDIIKADRLRSTRTLLDHGCHTGGLTSRAVAELEPKRVWALEPVLRSRQKTAERLRARYPDLDAKVLAEDGWAQIPEGEVDVLISHEVLYLIEDLPALFREVARVLEPSATAYFVLGCHTENPVWQSWKQELRAMGHITHDHSPFDVLDAGAQVGLNPALRPLRASGWVHYDPCTPQFAFNSAQELLDHQFRHKLLFRFTR